MRECPSEGTGRKKRRRILAAMGKSRSSSSLPAGYKLSQVLAEVEVHAAQRRQPAYPQQLAQRRLARTGRPQQQNRLVSGRHAVSLVQ